MYKKKIQIITFTALILANVNGSVLGNVVWSAEVKNATNITLQCQAFDYSNSHVDRQLQHCVYTEGEVGPGNTGRFNLSYCDAVSLDTDNIGIDCYGPGGKCYQLIRYVKSGSTVTMNCSSPSFQKKK